MKRLFYLALMIVGSCIVFTSVTDAQTPEGGVYKVGIGDVINITVMGHKDLSMGVAIAFDGTIAYPHLGALYVKDKSLLEIKEEITNKLGEGYIKYPVVSVALASSISKRIFIRGPVGNIGAISFEKDLSVIKALSLAGGIGEDALYGKVKVRRRHEGSPGYKEIAEAKLNKGFIDNIEMEDMLLQPEDIIIIERSETFFVRGEVNVIGRLVLEDGMTVSRAITLSGGIAENGLHGKVKVRRKREGSTRYFDVIEAKLDDGNLTNSEMEDMLLQPDDILQIERNESYFIEGEVMQTGRYLLEYGMTVGRAITVAGGIAEGGLYGKVKVRRKREGEPGYDDIEIDIRGIIEGSETGDMLLQPDDILIIERNETYIMYGEVGRIGEYPIANNITVFKAILAAGGFSKWGSESRVKILRLTDDGKGFVTIKVDINDVLDGDIGADVSLHTGDIVIVSSGLF